MSALDIQIGGEHYKNAKIQPVQYIEANGLGFLEGCVVKRITRHDKPTGKGRQDIEKAIHELQLLLEFRYSECPECGYPTDAAGTHYATCSQLTAPEEYKAEAQVAFDEAAEISEALARQLSAGKIDTDFDWDGAVAEEEALIEAEEEPAAAMDDDSPRMQAIGQNGNGGEHYDDPFAGAPEWAKYKAQQEHGAWEFYEDEPTNERGFWRHELRGVRSGEVGERNPNWRDTLITRT